MSSWPFSVCAWLEEHAGDVALTGKQREARYYPLSTYDPTPWTAKRRPRNCSTCPMLDHPVTDSGFNHLGLPHW